MIIEHDGPTPLQNDSKQRMSQFLKGFYSKLLYAIGIDCLICTWIYSIEHRLPTHLHLGLAL